MRIDDLIITVAYFSIPLQLLGSLSMYPRLASMPPKVVTLCLLFCFFIFLCGAGHLMRCLNLTHTTGFLYLNSATAIVSLITAIYLLPLVPSLMGQLDQSLQDLVNLNHETNESKKKLFTFMAFLCHEIRNPLFAITSSVDCLLATTTTSQNTTTTSCLTKEQQIAVGSIMDSSHLMLRLANDVLDLSKIDAGKLILEETTFHLHRLLERLAHSMETQVRQRQQFVTWSFHLDKEMVPKQILGDSVRILQIVYNLCSNAIKFTSKGRVELKISICTPEQAQRVGLHSFYNNNSLQQEEAAKQSSPKTTTKTTNNTRNTNNNNNYYNDSFGTSFIVDGTTEEDESNAFSMSLLDSMENGCDYGGCSNNTTTSSSNHYYQSVATTEQQNQPENDHNYQSNNTDQRVLLQIEVSDTGSGIPSERLPSIFEPYSQSKLSDYRKHGGTGLGLSIISGLVKAMEGKITVQSTLHKGSTFLVYLPMKVAPDDEDEDASDDEDDEDDDMIRTTTPLLLHETGSGLNHHQQEQEEQHPLLQQEHQHHQQQQTNGGSNRVLPVILSSRRLPLLENTEHFLLKRCGSETTLNDLGHVSITTASHLLPLPSSPTRSRSLGAKINGRGTYRDDEQTRSGSTTLLATTMTADSLQKGVSMALSSSSSPLPPPPPSGQQQQSSHVPTSTLLAEPTKATSPQPSNMMPLQRQSSSSSSLSTTKKKKKKKKKTKNNPLMSMKPFSFKEPNKKIVLVVDDNQMNLKILGRMLHNFHLLYHTAENGKEALNLILKQQKEEEQYALILMDICMPIMDGYEAIQEIRKQQQNNIGIPIIALTANALSTERERAIQVGANGFHTKPILRKDLYALCKQYLGEDDEEENYESNNNNDRGRSSIMKNKNGNRDDHVVNGDGHKKKNGNSPDYMEASTSDVSAVMPAAVV